MATIHVRHVPADVHAALGRRALSARRSVSDYVLDLIRRDVEDADWNDAWRAVEPVEGIAVTSALDRSRGER